MEALLAAARPAGDLEGVHHRRTQQEQLYKAGAALQEEKNLLLRAQQAGAPYSSCHHLPHSYLFDFNYRELRRRPYTNFQLA